MNASLTYIQTTKISTNIMYNNNNFWALTMLFSFITIIILRNLSYGTKSISQSVTSCIMQESRRASCPAFFKCRTGSCNYYKKKHKDPVVFDYVIWMIKLDNSVVTLLHPKFATPSVLVGYRVQTQIDFVTQFVYW